MIKEEQKMGFIYLKVVTNNDDTETKDLRTFSSWDEALSTYHYQLGSSINKCKECIYALIDTDGNLRKCEKWTAPVAEPAAEEAPLEDK